MNANVLKKSLRFFTWAWVIVVAGMIITPGGIIPIVKDYGLLIGGVGLILGIYNVVQEFREERVGI